jgi:hypothetical protein
LKEFKEKNVLKLLNLSENRVFVLYVNLLGKAKSSGIFLTFELAACFYQIAANFESTSGDAS